MVQRGEHLSMDLTKALVVGYMVPTAERYHSFPLFVQLAQCWALPRIHEATPVILAD